MGKPARWLKSVLLGKKPSKSSGSKDKEVTHFRTMLYDKTNEFQACIVKFLRLITVVVLVEDLDCLTSLLLVFSL